MAAAAACVVVVAGYPTATLPSTTPVNVCPNPEDFAVYDYFNDYYFILEYPANGEQVQHSIEGFVESRLISEPSGEC